MNFTESIFETLTPYEKYFDTAVKADWCPNPGRKALGVMCDALDAHDGGTGRRTPRDFNCGACQLRIVKRCGYLYFADKAQREAVAAPEAPKPAKTASRKKTTKKTS